MYRGSKKSFSVKTPFQNKRGNIFTSFCIANEELVDKISLSLQQRANRFKNHEIQSEEFTDGRYSVRLMEE